MADSKHSKFQVNSTENVKLVMYIYRRLQGRSQDFSKGGGGGHTGSNNIVMAFSPRKIVGCLLTKRLTKGGVTGTPGPP